MFRVAVGHSNDPDSQSAIREVLQQCRDTLGTEVPIAGILFAAIDFEHDLILREINQAFRGIELIGGTSDAEISSVLEFQQDSLTLMVFCSDEVEICAGVGRGLSRNPASAALQAVESAQAKSRGFNPQLCLTTPESLTADGVSIVDSLKLALGEFPIFGGLTSDRMRFEKTYQFYNTEVLRDCVPILLFSGELLFSCGVANGWHPIGKKGIITKVDGRIIYEIDTQPAIDFYDRYLGGLAPSPEYPLAILDPQAQDFYTRSPHSCDRQTKTIHFLAQVPHHAIVQITHASRHDILAAVKTSVTKALKAYPGEPQAALFFSCAARRQLLGTQTNVEYQLAQSSLSQVLPSCGFYTHGEISPLKHGTPSRLHHDTFVTLLLGTR